MSDDRRARITAAEDIATRLGFTVHESDLRSDNGMIYLVMNGFRATVEVRYAMTKNGFWAFAGADVDRSLARDSLPTWADVEATLKALHDGVPLKP